jgi:hypothetical protein
VSNRPERDALRAECEASGLHCPSCGRNPADLIAGHHITFSGSSLPASLLDGGTAQCAGGELISLAVAGFDTIKWLANIDLLDEYHRRMDAEFAAMLGETAG